MNSGVQGSESTKVVYSTECRESSPHIELYDMWYLQKKYGKGWLLIGAAGNSVWSVVTVVTSPQVSMPKLYVAVKCYG